MVQRTVKILVCDLCDGEDLVQKHTLAVDGKPVEFEACERCWQDVLAKFAEVAKVGRRVRQQRTKKRDVMAFPGTRWDFTAHALVRMGERHIKPVEAARAADDPEVIREGKRPGTVIHQRGNVKVTLKPSAYRVLTVARPEDVD